MNQIYFKIVQIKAEPLDIPLEKIRLYPLQEHYLGKCTEFMLLYRYQPTSKLDIEAYKAYLCQHFKKVYNAFSVTAGEPEKVIDK
tara:strand:- start:1521 stop:1775 length:255 start_codon:yes stop_codon:yes gene_type:complete